MVDAFVPDGIKYVLIICGEADRQHQGWKVEMVMASILQQSAAQVFFQWKSVDAPCLGTGDAASDELMNWCVHACNLMGAVRVKQAETCTVTL